jgi:hypothetical protein
MTRAKIGDVIVPKKVPLRIHVNQHNIRSNKSKATDLPVITIKRGSENFYANGIQTKNARILYSGAGCDVDPILNCGARVIMETNEPIEVTA